MSEQRRKAKDQVGFVAHGHGDVVWSTLRKRLRSQASWIGFRRDLSEPWPEPPSRTPFTVRPLEAQDRDVFLPQRSDLSSGDVYELAFRLRMFDYGLRTPYAAFDEAGNACYVQWMMDASQNDKIRRFFGGTFPPLLPGEVLMEAVYTFPDRRSLGIMAAALSRITEAARRDRGYRVALGYIADHNVPSLKCAGKAGYSPFIRRHERWFLFRRDIRFTSVYAAPPISRGAV